MPRVSMALVPVYLALMGLVYGITAYPFGMLADRIDRRLQLGVGGATLVACHLALAGAQTSYVVAIGAVLWGLQLGIIDGLLGASVADAAPQDLRGTAFGVYYFVIGIASLAASTLAGALWGIGGAWVTFTVGAVLASLAVFSVYVGRSKLPGVSPP